MEKRFVIDGQYVNIPIKIGAQEYATDIIIGGENFTEFKIPVDKTATENYKYDFIAQLNIKEHIGKEITISGDLSEVFLEKITCSNEKIKASADRPIIHFTADTGWTNDPNGLVYADGIYHLYFQYNPLNTIWHNMCWGHATSTDLLHWTQEDIVMYPDEDGEMFSGSGIKNDRGMLGLPNDALLFFYTVAGDTNEWSKGKEFTQKISYSLDGGKTLTKIMEPCVDTIVYDNRDPKVFWHDKTNAYIMVLWIKEQDFGILRSTDLKNWVQTDQITLEGGWECPDLFELKAPDGSSKWFFWSAQGYYYTGDFDGFKFKLDGIRRKAYVNEVPYAAQTYSGIVDRRISIPWVRYENDGRFYTGACGIPVEFSCDLDYNLLQKPVREIKEVAVQVTVDRKYSAENKALVIEMSGKQACENLVKWKINATDVEYSCEEGIFKVGEEEYKVISECDDFMMIIDDRMLEVFFSNGQMLGTFDLINKEVSFELVNNWNNFKVYEII